MIYFPFSLVLLNLHTQIRAKYQERMGFSPVIVLSVFSVPSAARSGNSQLRTHLSLLFRTSTVFIMDYATTILRGLSFLSNEVKIEKVGREEGGKKNINSK